MLSKLLRLKQKKVRLLRVSPFFILAPVGESSGKFKLKIQMQTQIKACGQAH